MTSDVTGTLTSDVTGTLTMQGDIVEANCYIVTNGKRLYTFDKGAPTEVYVAKRSCNQLLLIDCFCYAYAH